MSVRAKFKVGEIRSVQHSARIDTAKGWEKENLHRVEMRTIVLDPVSGNGDPGHENTKFWNQTPSGQIQLGTINPEAWAEFELGGEYYIDFTKA